MFFASSRLAFTASNAGNVNVMSVGRCLCGDLISCRHRHFFTFPTGKSFTGRKEYKACKLVGYSTEQMFAVVSDVGKYSDFLPFCKKSLVVLRRKDYLEGELMIGLPPIVESYTSRVTMKENTFVKAECVDSKLFDHLITIWKFQKSETPNAAVVTFYLSFQFKSLLHSQMIHLVFNELVHKMENSFLKEAKRRYGKPSVPTRKLEIN